MILIVNVSNRKTCTLIGYLCKSQPFPKQSLVFTCLWYKCLENAVETGEVAHNEQFLFFPHCFLPIWRTSCYFHLVQNCRL